MAELRAVINLEDNFSAQIRAAIENTDIFRQSVLNTRNTLDGFSNGRFEATIILRDEVTRTVREVTDTLSGFRSGNYESRITVRDEAEQQISETQKALNKIKANFTAILDTRNEASRTIREVRNDANALVKKNYRLEISAIDKTKSIIKGLTDSIFNLKTLAAGIILGGTTKVGYDWTIKNASENENYLATLQTVLHSEDKGKEALKWSYKDAASTPFDAKQVVSGVTQLATSGLDYEKYLNPLGDAAAAMNKPLEQAIFAMSKLKSGQLGMAVDMFRDFGISNQDWTKAGAKFAKNGEMTGVTPDQATDMVTKIINDKYGGLMDRKSGTADGMLSNMGDSISSVGRGLAGIDGDGMIEQGGMFDNFKQQLANIAPLLDGFKSSNAFAKLKEDIANLATVGGEKLSAFLEGFKDPEVIQKYEDTFAHFVKEVENGASAAITFAKAAGSILGALRPVMDLVIAHPNIFIGLFAGFEVGKGAFTAIGIMQRIREELPYVGTAVGVFGLNVQATLVSLGGAIKIFATSAMASMKQFFVFMLTTPVGLTITAIIASVVLLYEAWQHNWGGIHEKTQAVIDYVKTKIESIKETFENVKKKVIEFADDIKKFWQGIVDFFSGKSVKANVDITKTETTNAGTGMPPSTAAMFGGAEKANTVGKPFWEQHNALGTDYWKGGLTWVGENGPELLDVNKGAKVHSNRDSMNMVNAMSNNPSMISTLPSDFSKTGEKIPNSLSKGIKKTSGIAQDSMTQMSEDLLKTFGTGITDNSKYATKSTDDLSAGIQGIFSILGKKSNPLGRNVTEGLGQGIQDSTDNVTEISKTLTDKVIETFKAGFDIHSPSRVMHEIGSHVMQGFVNGLGSKDLKAFADKQIGTITAAFGSAVNLPGGVADWLTQALMATGTPLSWLPGLEKLVMAESGGDPNNSNLQSVGGEHATGLLQTLPSTFKEFMQKGMNNILNPVDNAASAINYIKSRYGDVYNTPLFKGGTYAGYATGTTYATPGYHWVGEKGPELMKFNGGEDVINHKDSQKALGSKDIKVYVKILGNVIGNEEFADQVGERIVDKVVAVLDTNM